MRSRRQPRSLARKGEDTRQRGLRYDCEVDVRACVLHDAVELIE
jgi:hypothetical protein